MKTPRGIARALADRDQPGPLDGGATEPEAHLRAAGYRHRGIYEGISSGHPRARDVVESWTADASRRKALLGDYAEIGVGYAAAPDGTPYWCIFVARPASPGN